MVNVFHTSNLEYGLAEKSNWREGTFISIDQRVAAWEFLGERMASKTISCISFVVYVYINQKKKY